MKLILSELTNGLIGLIFTTLVGAFFLRIAARRVIRRQLTYGQACTTVLPANLATVVLAVTVVVLVALMTDSEAALMIALVCMLPVWMLILAAFIGRRHRTTFDKGCQMSLTVTAIMILIQIIAGTAAAIVTRGFL